LLGSVRPIDAGGGSAVIGGSSPAMKSLEPMAIEWLKGAMAKLMSDLEAECASFFSGFFKSNIRIKTQVPHA
jgi:hypothetical protein